MDLMPKVYLQVSVIMLYVYLICKFLIYKTELEDDYDYVTQKACWLFQMIHVKIS